MPVASRYPLILGLGRLERKRALRRNGAFQYLIELDRSPGATSLRRFRHRTALPTRAVPKTRPILVLDSTVLTADGRQGQAAIGFTPKKRGRPAYLPLLSFDGTTRAGWAASFHPGATHVSAITLPLLAEAWAK